MFAQASCPQKPLARSPFFASTRCSGITPVLGHGHAAPASPLHWLRGHRGARPASQAASEGGRGAGAPSPGRGPRGGPVAWASKEVRRRAAAGRRRCERRLRGRRSCRPHLLHKSQAAKPRHRRGSPSESGGSVGSAPGSRRVAPPAPGVRSTAAGTRRPLLPATRRPSRFGSGRARPGTPLASAPAQLAPLAGGYVPCRQQDARQGRTPRG